MRLVVIAALSACAFAVPALPARAQVAVAVTIAEEDPSQREIAGKVVSVARQSWRMLQPQLSSEQTKACPPGDTACLRNVAAQGRATFLLVVGVAPLGVRDRVVAVQLFDVNRPGPLFEESVVQAGTNDDLDEVRALASRLVAGKFTPLPPAYVDPPPFVPTAVEPPSDIGPLSVGGFILVGAGGVTAAASALTGWALVEDKNSTLASDVMLFGIATGGALAAVGTIAFAVDAL